jgi:hypothetical protein
MDEESVPLAILIFYFGFLLCIPEKVRRFLDAHHGRQGVSVLAFDVENVEDIKARYEKYHPKLLDSYFEPDKHRVLEVFACYNKHTEEAGKQADKGTVLRFVQFAMNENKTCTALGMIPVNASFDESSQAAYCDHWVSNVFDRTEFLQTLQDTLGFTPKVDFNAGVVAAGEAQIESTVTGNTSLDTTTMDAETALKDQSQVYLPINNALSSVGHVHGFLHELGQGIQHVASRVNDLVGFVQRGNEYLTITGEGFTFLNIPRSYYGVLTMKQLTEGIIGDGSDAVSEECAAQLVAGLESSGALSKDGALDLALDNASIDMVLQEKLSGSVNDEYTAKKDAVLAVILRSRYRNLYSLLRDHASEETYLGIVRNQILVDVQGDDLLYQIFTANIMQRKTGEEAPFFEFIQRVCSDAKIKPGCGGFGVRNFLTLFLSIEVSKAMQEVTIARAANNLEQQEYAQKMVDYFTEQLNESNPILTEISGAMTDEGHCQEKLAASLALGDKTGSDRWRFKLEAAAERKKCGNAKLMETSSRYNKLMKSIRLSRTANRQGS